MNPDEAIFTLKVVDELHTEGYITDEAFERFQLHLGIKIIDECAKCKKPWWKIW